MIRPPPRSTPLYSSAASDVYKRQTYQIRRGDIGGGMRGRQVEIEQRLDQSLWMRWKQRRFPLDRCPAEKKPSYRAAWTPPLAAQKPDAAERLLRLQQQRIRYNEACKRAPERPLWQALS